MAVQQHKESAQKKQSAGHERQPTVRQSVPLQAAPDLQRALEDPAQASPAEILQLQQAAGNRAVSGLIQANLLQARLHVGPVRGAFEQQAGRMADHIRQGTASPPQAHQAIQRAIEIKELVIRSAPVSNVEEGLPEPKTKPPRPKTKHPPKPKTKPPRPKTKHPPIPKTKIPPTKMPKPTTLPPVTPIEYPHTEQSSVEEGRLPRPPDISLLEGETQKFDIKLPKGVEEALEHEIYDKFADIDDVFRDWKRKWHAIQMENAAGEDELEQMKYQAKMMRYERAKPMHDAEKQYRLQEEEKRRNTGKF